MNKEKVHDVMCDWHIIYNKRTTIIQNKKLEEFREAGERYISYNNNIWFTIHLESNFIYKTYVTI